MKLVAVIVLVTLVLVGSAQLMPRSAAASFVPPNRSAVPAPAPRPAAQRSLFQPVGFAGTIFTGKFVYNISISIKSTIPTADVISCSGSAATFDGSGKNISEIAGVAATRAGSSASCSVAIPYSWSLTTSSTDMVALSYTITVPVGGGAALPNRSSIQGLGSIHVPASGSTTTETISATI